MIGVIGCGNMAEAIVRGFHQKNTSMKFLTYTPSFTRANLLAQRIGGSAVKSLFELKDASTIIVACKPQQLDELAENIKKADLELSSKHIISILAATPISTITEKLNVSRVSRVMPNTPSMVGMGMSLILHSNSVNEKEVSFVNEFFSACGETQEISTEELFDKVTTVSGSGPAYVFLFAKFMADELISWGVSPSDAKKIAIQLFRGSSELMSFQNDLSLEQLISNVTSKGGVTIEAVESFKANGLDELTRSALQAACLRSEEIRSSN